MARCEVAIPNAHTASHIIGTCLNRERARSRGWRDACVLDASPFVARLRLRMDGGGIGA